MDFILENIRKFLSEGRVEDVKKKFPQIDTNIVDFFVNEDPSGNQKYLEWLVKAVAHEPTVTEINNSMFGISSNEPSMEIANFLINIVKSFHKLLPYMIHTHETFGEQGTTDLYQYKFTDSDMIHYFMGDLVAAKERKEKKEKEKNAEKNSDKIYNDDSWLVVRPNTWESSCVYGSGTRWCTTSKENDRHFKRETDRNFLIYVINKSKTNDDPEYKVAWQVPYKKHIKKSYTTSEGDVNIRGIKLWNAEDTNITNRASIGLDYIDTIPKEIKDKILGYMQDKMDAEYANLAYVGDPHLQALVEYLGLNDEEVEDVDRENYTHYTLRVYQYGTTVYAVGNDDDIEEAKRDWARSLVDDLGVAELMGNNLERYITINNIEGIADDMTDGYMEDMSDEEVILTAGRISGIKTRVEEYEINKGIFETNQEEIDEMWKKYNDLTEEEETDLKELETENEGIEKHNEKLFSAIRDAVRDDYYDDYVTRLSNDPVDWLWEMGYYSKKNGLERITIQNNIVDFDENLVVDDLVDDFEMNSIGEYNEVTVEGRNYYVFTI